MTVKPIVCAFCSGRHGDRWLCDPAKAILDGMAARAAEVDMPVLDFADSPIPASSDVIMRQVTVMAGTIPVGPQEHKFPALVLSGLDQHSKPLPRWTYPSDPANMLRLKDLFISRIDLAIAYAD